MSSLCRRGLVLGLVGAGLLRAGETFRVCADPDNLPFSNQAREGFENRVAELIARDLGARLEYTWSPQRKSFIEGTLDANRCDAVIGLPAALDSVLTTKPYYRSTYVFVSRRDRKLNISSLTDARLADLRIGIHIVGDGYAPPAAVLSRRGLSANLVGFSMYPASKLIDAVAKGEVDIAVAWGPPAGYFAKRESQALDISPVSPATYLAVPFTYEISAGVRKNDSPLQGRLDGALTRQCAAIQRVLTEYGVPTDAEGGLRCEGPPPSRSALSH